ncbi:hypothetical protein K438DRAFT_1773099 [Mycena galopus ATCC 62051]|nr:hypothetical protein K438DRAFT_1773099 [Mycena galopus ATCC 62051]
MASKYLEAAPSLLTDPSSEAALDLDFTKGPVWYLPREHWLGWMPREIFLFSNEAVQFTHESVNMYSIDNDSMGPGEPTSVLSGLLIAMEWVDEASVTAKRLHSVAVSLASASPWYCHYNSSLIEHLSHPPWAPF